MIKFVLGILCALPFAAMGNPTDITPLKDAHFVQDEDVKCLKNALANGNPDTGPSMFLLKAPAGCHVVAHYHTAEEVLIVIRGKVWTEMKGMPGSMLTAGGIAVMPAKAIHWFSCSGKEPCLMLVTFNQKYDIVWTDPVT
jgi:quercetin dioxygenase-like cupin family protein